MPDIIDVTHSSLNRGRTIERERFLQNVFVTAIENYGTGFFSVDEYKWDEDRPNTAHAIITEMDAPFKRPRKSYRIDITTIARGLAIIRKAFPATHDNGTYYVNADTFEQLGFGGPDRDQLLLADRTNGEDGDIDVIGALAVLECAIYGQVIYS